jgi:hypothetical protein
MEPDSDEELAAIVTRMADDRAATAVMGRRGRWYVLQHYNRDQLAAEYLDLLNSITTEPRTSTLLTGAQP